MRPINSYLKVKNTSNNNYFNKYSGGNRRYKCWKNEYYKEINLLIGEEFIPHQATIGVDFTYIENKVKDEDEPTKTSKISLQIWDTCK